MLRTSSPPDGTGKDQLERSPLGSKKAHPMRGYLFAFPASPRKLAPRSMNFIKEISCLPTNLTYISTLSAQHRFEFRDRHLTKRFIMHKPRIAIIVIWLLIVLMVFC